MDLRRDNCHGLRNDPILFNLFAGSIDRLNNLAMHSVPRPITCGYEAVRRYSLAFRTY
jgi:hypothetical protein